MVGRERASEIASGSAIAVLLPLHERLRIGRQDPPNLMAEIADCPTQWCERAQASMATTQGSWTAMTFSRCARDTCGATQLPRVCSGAIRLKHAVGQISRPMTPTSSMHASAEAVLQHPPSWQINAAGKRSTRPLLPSMTTPIFTEWILLATTKKDSWGCCLFLAENRAGATCKGPGQRNLRAVRSCSGREYPILFSPQSARKAFCRKLHVLIGQNLVLRNPAAHPSAGCNTHRQQVLSA